MEALIFGYTWEEIQAAQQGKPLKKVLPERVEGAENDPCMLGDVNLLVLHGLKELENRGYFGVIDRLARAGVVGAHGGKPCIGVGCPLCDEEI